MTDAELDANPFSCQSRHPTATDVTPKMARRPPLVGLFPVVGPDGKNLIDRHPIKCHHGRGHQGRHGYGSLSWDDADLPARVNEAMQGAPHDGRLFRQARAAIATILGAPPREPFTSNGGGGAP